MKKKSAYNVAIAGVTGAVGQEFLGVLEKRKFPIANLLPLASSRSVGRKITFKGKEYTVKELKADSFKNIDIALFSAGGSRSKEFAPAAVKAGAVVVDNSSAFRMEPDVPLVVPEVNADDVKKHKGIIANPNCTTILANVAIWPIHKLAGIKRMVVTTYQAVSGAGAKAIDELRVQSENYLAGKPLIPKSFQYPIAFNLFSHDSKIDENGYCVEEVKMIKETRKIFHDNKIQISPTTIRISTFRAHAEAIHLDLAREVSVEEVRGALSKAPGVKVIDERDKNYFPMPIEVSGKDEVYVGRIRKDLDLKNGLNLFICGDQLLKGAALNAVQIAEKLI